jgi:fluoroquinolone transport system permease protein
MNNLLRLLLGEIRRLLKYKILLFGLIFTFIWIVVIAFANKDEAVALMPFLLVVDTGVMAIVLLAASFYYEKQEGTIKTLMVAPVSTFQILLAKIIASLLSGLITIVLVSITMITFHGVIINYALALLYVFLSTLVHVAIGYIIIFRSRDFLSLMIKYFILVLLLMTPVLLVALDIIPIHLEFIAFLSPTYAVQFLVNSLFVNKDWWKILIATIYLLILISSLYPLVVYRQFKKYAVKG